jgi:hypothetical protein
VKSHNALLLGIAVVAASAVVARFTANRNLFLQTCRWIVIWVVLLAGILAGVFGSGHGTQSGSAEEKEWQNRYRDAKILLLAGIPSLLALVLLRFIP